MPECFFFLGTSISWVGTVEPLSNGSTIVNSTASATYTIDDQDPINFLVPVSSNSLSYFNQIFFDTGQLSFGQHKLVVTYFGNTTSAPLALNYFVQEDSDAPTSTTSNSSPTSTSTSVPSGSSSNSSAASSSTTIKPTAAIIGGVIGGIVLISLLLALFFFNRRRNSRKLQALEEESYISPGVLNPFTVSSPNPTSDFLPENYTSNGHIGQSLPSQPISGKFTQMSQQPSDPASMSSSGGNTPLPPLRPQFSLPASPSSSSLPLTGRQTNFDGTKTTEVSQDETEPLMHHQSLAPGGANARILLHEDSGVRIPPAEDNVEELPPNYTPG